MKAEIILFDMWPRHKSWLQRRCGWWLWWQWSWWQLENDKVLWNVVIPQ